MALMIIEDCIGCGACEPECPNSAITEGQSIYVIDPNHCTECFGYYRTQQCAEVCPVESCVKDPDRAESPSELLEKFHGLYPDRAPENIDIWNAPVL